MRHNSKRGFTLVELLLVLAVIGIITVVAIPSLTGQRQRAERIGDAESNARILAMGLEARKAENGIYGPAGATATWAPNAPPAWTGYTANPLPNFAARGNSKMTYLVTVQPLTYTIDVHGGNSVAAAKWLTVDQTGAKTLYVK